MPVYEYECSHCGSVFELLQSVSARPPRKCAECGEPGGVSKRISAPAFQFKGSGWYVTDYAGKGKDKGKAESSGEDKGSTESGKESKGSDEKSKSDKPEKADKGDKSGKSDRSEKSDRSDRSDRSDKSKAKD